MSCVVVLQPSYLPWLGYFEQLAKADDFVYYDDVQYDKHGWRNRNRVKTSQGPQWLTVPVLTHGQEDDSIRAARIDVRQPWARKHLMTLRTYYAKAPYFAEIYEPLAAMLQRDWQGIAALDEALISWIAGYLGLAPRVHRASDLGISGGKTERLVNLCRHFGADTYFSGRAATDYLDMAQFEAAGIRVEFQDYHHPVYRQLYGDFVSHLSVVDLLFNEGPASSAILLAKGAITTT